MYEKKPTAEELLEQARALIERANKMTLAGQREQEIDALLQPAMEAAAEGELVCITWLWEPWTANRRGVQYRYAAVRRSDGLWALTGRQADKAVPYSELLAKLAAPGVSDVCYVSEWTQVLP